MISTLPISLFDLIFSLFVSFLVLDEHGFLRAPKLTVQAASINELLMGSTLGDATLIEHDDDVRVIDGAEAVCNEDRSALLLSDERVDMQEKRLFSMCVQCGGLNFGDKLVSCCFFEE